MNRIERLSVAVTLGCLTLALAFLYLSPSPALGAPPAPGGSVAGVLTVCPAGPPDCQHTSIQAAVDAAAAGDLIKVAAGVYTDVHDIPAPPGFPYPPPGGVITQVVYVDRDLTMRGGYTAPAFADPPDPVANPTTIDAAEQGRGLLVGSDAILTLEGLTVTGGNAYDQGGHVYGGAGGGIYVFSATLTATHTTVTNNRSDWHGGGLHAIDSQVSFDESTIRANYSEWDGSGLYLEDSRLWLTHSTVSENVGWGYAGGLGQRGGTARLVGNTITGNRAIGNYGGGLFFVNGQVELDSNVIAANISHHSAGGVWIGYGEATLRNNTIADNQAEDVGGGVFIEEAKAALYGNTILANEGGWGGGGFYLKDSSVTLERNTVVANAGKEGSGVMAYGSQITMTNNVVADNQAGVEGSGLYLAGGSTRLIHTTIARNSDGDGCGIHVVQYSGKAGTATLTNTILAGHTTGVCVEAGNTAALEATLWGGGTWANQVDWAGEGTILTGTHNVWGYPAFVAPDVRNYHLQAGSAAINGGVDAGVSEDLDGEPRPAACLPDLGADEVSAINPPTNFRVTQAVTGTGWLTATLAWDPAPGAETYTIRTASNWIDEGNWAQAAVVTDSLPGGAVTYDAVVAYHGAPVYFAARAHGCGVESAVSRSTFWPRWDTFLPVVLKNR